MQKSLILLSIVGIAIAWTEFEIADGLSKIPDQELLKLAYFIDPDDDVIKYWVSRKLPSPNENSYERAEAAFEILGKNICCLPKTDWDVSYPRELLRLKVGNLYDCAILYAAILERLEVPVMLALTPERRYRPLPVRRIPASH